MRSSFMLQFQKVKKSTETKGNIVLSPKGNESIFLFHLEFLDNTNIDSFNFKVENLFSPQNKAILHLSYNMHCNKKINLTY